MKAKDFIQDWETIVSAESVFEYYLGEKVLLGKMYKSPLRADKHPTCSFWFSKKGVLYFHDFGVSKMYNAIAFVQEKFQLLSFKDAIKKVLEDAHLMRAVEVEKKVVESNFDFVAGDFKELEDYWSRYRIPLKIAAKFAFYAKTVYKNESLYARSTKGNPIIIYKFVSGHIKIYRPLSTKDKKWAGNSTAEDVGGFYQLPKKGVLCFITSSIKDIMVLRQHGFPAICFNGESYGSGENKETNKTITMYINILKKRYKYVLLFLDHDDSGIKASHILSRKYNIPYVTTQSSFCKDISDYQSKHGVHLTYRLIKKLVKSKFKKDEIPF